MSTTTEQNNDRVATTSTTMSTAYNVVESMLRRSGKGLSRIEGDSYHLRLAIMIILRAYRLHQIDNKFDFAVALEVTAAGKFDDIVYSYSSPAKATGTVCIQAKHKQNMGSKIEQQGLCAAWNSKSKEFSIPTYFVSFLENDQNLPNDAHYILCTTVGLHESLTKHFMDINQQRGDNIHTPQNAIRTLCKDIQATCYQLRWDETFPALIDALKDSCLSKLGTKLALFVCTEEIITFEDTIFSTFFNLIYKCIEQSELETSDPSVILYKLTTGFSEEVNSNKETTEIHQTEEPTPELKKIQAAFKKERKWLFERKFKKNNNIPEKELKIKFNKVSFISALDAREDAQEFAKFYQKVREFSDKFVLMCNSYNEETLREEAITLLPQWCTERGTVFDKLQGTLLDAMKAGTRVPMDLAFWQNIFVNVNLKQHITDVMWYSKEHLKSVHEKHPHIEVNPKRLKAFKLYAFLQESGAGICEYNSMLDLKVISRILLQALSLLQYETIFVNSANYTKQQDMYDVLDDLLSYLSDVNHPTIKVVTILAKHDFVSINQINELSDKYRQKIIVVAHITESPQNYNISERIFLKDLSAEASHKLYNQTVRMMFGTNTPLSRIMQDTDDLCFLLNVLEPTDEMKEMNHCLNLHNYEQIKHWYVHPHFMPYEQKGNVNDLHFNSGREIKFALATGNEELDPPGFQTDDNGKVFIFLNDAGHGKTTYFTWLAWRLSTSDPSLYVIKFNAMEYTIDFKRLKDSDIVNLEETEIVRILYRYIHLALCVPNINKRTIKDTDEARSKADRCAKLLTFSNGKIVLDETEANTLSTTEQIELRLYREKFNEQKLVIILDGFDEIAPYFVDEVMNCFAKFSLLDGVRLLYLSSRPYSFEVKLKTTFQQCRIYRLEPFTKNHIITSLHKFLVNNLDGYDHYKESLRNDILLMLFLIIHVALKDVITIPLLLYMVEVILLPEIKKRVNETTHTISKQMLNSNQIDILYLVEEFVGRKLNILNTDKLGTTDSAASTAAAKIKEVCLKKEITKKHMLLAMYVIFDKNHVEKLLSKQEQMQGEEIMEEVNKGEEKTGIVLGVQNGVPQFLHRIFAEYFTACWLFENWKRFKRESVFNSRIMSTDSLRKTREFFDRLILRKSEGCELHMALVNGSEDQIVQILRNNPTAVTVKDRVGRLAIHLLEYINSWFTKIMDITSAKLLLESILKKMPPELINAKDELFGWNVIDYAFFHIDRDSIKMLFKRGVTPNRDNLVHQICSNDVYTSLWLVCTYTDCIVASMDENADLADELNGLVAKYLIEDNKIDVYASLAELYSSSVLESVATIGSFPMFCQLIEKSGPQKFGLAVLAKRLLKISLTEEGYEITNYLVEQFPSLVFMINDNRCLYLCAKKAIESNQMELFKAIFIQVCRCNKIKCVKKNIIIDDLNDQRENEKFEIRISCGRKCYRTNFYSSQKDTSQEVVTDIFSAAIYYDSIQIVRYILQMTNMKVTVEMIGNIMKKLRINYSEMHNNNIRAYKYLLNKLFDSDVDVQEGLNLFLLIINYGCVYMLHSLIAIGFNPSNIDMMNHWDVFKNRIFTSNQMCSANIFVYLQQRSYLDCFDAFSTRDESIFNFTIKKRRFLVAQALVEDKFRNLSIVEKENTVLKLLELNLFKYGTQIIIKFIKSLLNKSLFEDAMENEMWQLVYSSILNRIPIA